MKNSRGLILIFVLAGLSFVFYKSADIKMIAAGVAVFLFGMSFLEEGFMAFTGGILEKSFKNPPIKPGKPFCSV